MVIFAVDYNGSGDDNDYNNKYSPQGSKQVH